MDEMYKRARWAVPGRAGHDLAGWVAIAVGLLAAVWTFREVDSWWLAIPAAILAWLAATAVVGAIWALVRRLLEASEGI
ncbi:MAG: hypothetical protein SWO11_19250 [Thermodesulfobacteriota bacterium]|nr:hypothetical protein [Thermodesulfobacteriota bacterium]